MNKIGSQSPENKQDSAAAEQRMPTEAPSVLLHPSG